MAERHRIISPTVMKWILIVVLILLAAPLLGALAMMAMGSSMMGQVNGRTNGSMMGLATIWIGLIAVLIVAVIVSISRSIRRRKDSDRDKAA
jgi:membrane protein implicated in regulation of membrane protease activity